MRLLFNSIDVKFDKDVIFNYNLNNIDLINFKYNIGNSMTYKIPIKGNEELFEYINKIESLSTLYKSELEFIIADTPFGDIKALGIIKNISAKYFSVNLYDNSKIVFDKLNNSSLSDLDIVSYLATNGTTDDGSGTYIHDIIHPDFIFYPFYYNGSENEDYMSGSTPKVTLGNITINTNTGSDWHYLYLEKTNPAIRLRYLIDEIETLLGINFVDDCSGAFDNFVDNRYLTLTIAKYEKNKKQIYANITGNTYTQDVNKTLPNIKNLDFIKSVLFSKGLYPFIDGDTVKIKSILSNFTSYHINLNEYKLLDRTKASKFYKKMNITYAGVDCSKVDNCTAPIKKDQQIIYTFADNFKPAYKPYGEKLYQLSYGAFQQMTMTDEDTTYVRLMATTNYIWEFQNNIFEIDLQDYADRDSINVCENLQLLSTIYMRPFEPIKTSESIGSIMQHKGIIPRVIDYQNYIEVEQYLTTEQINQLSNVLFIEDDSTGNKFYLLGISLSNNKAKLKLIQVKELISTIEG